MSAYGIGQLVGGLLPILLLSWLARLALKKVISGYSLVAASVIIALGLATILGGYGMADGGPPQFEFAFYQYLMPAIIVGVVLAAKLAFFARRQVTSE